MRGCADSRVMHIERQVRALELRIGVDHDGNIDRIGDGAEIAFDLRVAEREIRFQDRENAVGAEFLIGLGLRHRIRVEVEATPATTGTRPVRGFDRGLHHGQALRVVEIGKLAGRAERRQPVHARLDEIIAQPASTSVRMLPSASIGETR